MDIVKCTELRPGHIVIVIPSLGYGFLSTMCARGAKGYGHSAPSSSLSHVVTKGERALKEAGEYLKVKHYGKEVFVPTKGMRSEMFVTSCRVNSTCSSSNTFDSDLILPIPIKISLSEDNDFTTQMKSETYVKGIQEALFRGALHILLNQGEGGEEGAFRSVVANEILRYYSATLKHIEDTDNQWTGREGNDDERVEYAHLHAMQVEGNPVIEGWDVKSGRTDTPPDASDIFIRPFVIVMIENADGNKRAFYSGDLTELLYSARLMGSSIKPEVVLENVIYLTDPDAAGGTAPDWGIVKQGDDISPVLGLTDDDYMIMCSDFGRISNVFDIDYISWPLDHKVWSYSEDAEVTKSIELYTFRTPVFTSAGLLSTSDQERKPFRLLFSSAYYLPAASGAMSDAVYGTCTRCNGKGVVGPSACLRCKGSKGIICSYCMGKDTKANGGGLDKSTGFLWVDDIKMVGKEQVRCNHCNPEPGVDPIDSNEYIELPGKLKCPDCEGKGVWYDDDPRPVCPGCGGTKLSFMSPAENVKTKKVDVIESISLIDDDGRLTGNTDLEGTYLTGNVYVHGLSESDLGFKVRGITLLYGNALVPITAKSPMGLDGIEFTGYGWTLLDSGTLEINILWPSVLVGEDIIKNNTLEVYVHDTDLIGINYGLVWTTDPNNVPLVLIGPEPVGDIHKIKKLMYKNPDDPEIDSNCEEVPFREGFGHLACAVTGFTSLIRNTKINSGVKDTSCFSTDSDIISKDLQDMGISPGKLSDGEPIRLYDETWTQNIEDFNTEKPSGNPDELFLAPKLNTTGVTGSREHKKIWNNSSPRAMSSLEIWESAVNKVSDLYPAMAYVDESRVYPYAIKKSAKYITGGKSADTAADLSKGVSIPLSYGEREEGVINPINFPTPTSVSSNGIVDIVSILSDAANSPGASSIGTAESVIKSVAVTILESLKTIEKVLIVATKDGSSVISQPEPLFGLTDGEVTVDPSLVSVIDELKQVSTVLSTGGSTSEEGPIKEYHEKYERAMNDLEKVTAAPDKNASILVTLSTALCQVLSFCWLKVLHIEDMIICEYTDNGSTYTDFLAISTAGEEVHLTIPHSYANKGLWFYNMRKSYFVLKSMVNLSRALIEKAYTMFSSFRLNFSHAPLSEQDNSIGKISYQELDISLFDNYPAIEGKDSPPSYAGNEEHKVHWDNRSIINLSNITSEIEINTIERCFEEGSIYYKFLMDIGNLSEITEEDEPVFLLGMGVVDAGSVGMDPPDEQMWVERGNIENEWTTIKDMTDEEAESETRAQRLAGVDYIKRGGSNIKYINKEKAGATAPYSTLEDLKGKLIRGNTADAAPIVPGSPSLECKIDMSYVFLYISDYSESFDFNMNLQVEFKSAKPVNLESSILSTINMTKYSSTGLEEFFGLEESMDNTFESWSGDKTKLDGAISELSARFSMKKWLDALCTDEEKTNKIYQVSFTGFSDPSLYPEHPGSCLMSYWLDVIENLTPKSGYLTDTERAAAMATNWWSQADSLASCNYNIFLSKRRAYVIAKYVVGGIIDNSRKEQHDVGDKYRAIFFYHNSTGTPTQADIPADIPAYSKYKVAADWGVEYSNNIFKCYGFGDLMGNGNLDNGDTSKDKVAKQRIVNVTAPSPWVKQRSITIDSNPGGELQINCTLPLGHERTKGTTPNIRISKGTVYFPSGTFERGKTEGPFTWDSGFNYNAKVMEDSFDVNGAPTTSPLPSEVARIYREMYDRLGDGAGEMDGYLLQVAGSTKQSSVSEKVEEFIKDCFTKSKIESDASYGKALGVHSSYLDKVWLFVMKKK
jgi:hypothetical protein